MAKSPVDEPAAPVMEVITDPSPMLDAEWPEPEEASVGGGASPSESTKRKRRRRKGKGQASGTPSGNGSPEASQAGSTADSVAQEVSQETRPRPPQSPPHQTPRAKIDPELLTKMAWKIYLAEVSEEGVALIGDHDAKDLSRRCFRLAEIFIEEQLRRR